MGLFNRKSKSDVTASGSASAPSGSTVGWVLRGGGVCAFKADPSWAEVIRASTPKVARVGHDVTVELRRDAAKNVTVWFDGQQVGVMSPEDSKASPTPRHSRPTSKMRGYQRSGCTTHDAPPPPCFTSSMAYLQTQPRPT